MRSGRTRGYHGVVGPFQAMRNRHISRCEIDQPAGNEERRHPPRSLLLQHYRRSGKAGSPADPRADHHSRFDLIGVAQGLPACIIERLARGAHGENNEIVDLALLLWFHPLVGIEAAIRAVATRNLTSDLRRQIGDVESFDAPGPALTLDEALPPRLVAASKPPHPVRPRDHVAPQLQPLSPTLNPTSPD